MVVQQLQEALGKSFTASFHLHCEQTNSEFRIKVKGMTFGKCSYLPSRLVSDEMTEIVAVLR